MKLQALSAFLAYVISRVIFNAMNFHYSMFQDPFSITKLAFDFGLFAALYLLSAFALSHTVFRKRG